ncbi:Protein SDS23, partial [Choanephora cucurbitarum]
MTHREGITTTTKDWMMIPVSNLVKNQKVIQIDGTLSVEEACQILVSNNISSAPVFSDPRHYIGMFDYGDVIAYILLVLHLKPGQDDRVDPDAFEIKDIVQRALRGQKVPVGMASDLSRKNPFYSILEEATLLSALEIFAYGTHRVSMLNPEGDISGILSQSTVVNYLYENRKQFPEIDQAMNKTIRELKLGDAPVIGVDINASVLDALSIMSSNGISSLAILQNNKQLMGNISITDVKHIMKGYTHRMLWKTCFQFISHVRTEQGMIDGQDRLPVFDVRKDASLGFTIAKLLATKAHRVWVVDDHQHAIGVVSLTDIIRVFASMVGIEVYERRA